MTLRTALAAVLVVLLLALARVADAEEETPIRDVIAAAAVDEGVSPDLLLCVTWHESRWNPRASSPTNDHGVAQFHVYADGSSLMDMTPWAGESPFDADAASHAAAWLMARGYGPHWVVWWWCA